MKWAGVSWSFQKRWGRNSTTERTVPPARPLQGKPRLWSSDPGRARKIAERGVDARKGLLFLTVGMVFLLSLFICTVEKSCRLTINLRFINVFPLPMWGLWVQQCLWYYEIGVHLLKFESLSSCEESKNQYIIEILGSFYTLSVLHSFTFFLFILSHHRCQRKLLIHKGKENTI